MRIPQCEGQRGSLKWIQYAVEHAPELIQPSVLPAIHWVSPRRDDGFAEYRDAGFLGIIGQKHLVHALVEFWPTRGPQWDALGVFEGGVVLVEAKAHVNEFLTPGSAAGSKSSAKIREAFGCVQRALNVKTSTSWLDTYYQYANRLAHLHFLRSNGVNAYLLFVSFVGDEDMNGPERAETWQAMFNSADYALGLSRQHSVSKFILHVYPDVNDFTR